MASPNVTTLTAERARDLFRYDPETGKLYWRSSNGGVRAGTEAGCAKGPIGYRYRRVKIDGRLYFAHRLAWMIITGARPPDQLDHIDGNGLNNRWNNLRAATSQVNARNAKRYSTNTSGIMGVRWNKRDRRWHARIHVNGANIHLGCFDNLPAASEARKAADRRYGFHENHGRKR